MTYKAIHFSKKLFVYIILSNLYEVQRGRSSEISFKPKVLMTLELNKYGRRLRMAPSTIFCMHCITKHIQFFITYL